MKQGCPLEVYLEALRKTLKPDPGNAGVGSYIRPTPGFVHLKQLGDGHEYRQDFN
jgi:hypothetical protein